MFVTKANTLPIIAVIDKVFFLRMFPFRFRKSIIGTFGEKVKGKLVQPTNLFGRAFIMMQLHTASTIFHGGKYAKTQKS